MIKLNYLVLLSFVFVQYVRCQLLYHSIPITTTEEPETKTFLESSTIISSHDNLTEDTLNQPSKYGNILKYVEALRESMQTNSSEQQQIIIQQQQQQQQATQIDEREREEVFPQNVIEQLQIPQDYSEPINRNVEYSESRSHSNQPIKAAVMTRYSIESKPFNPYQQEQSDRLEQMKEEELEKRIIQNEINQQIEPHIVEVSSTNFRPLQIHFKSATRRIKLVQNTEKGVQSEPEITRTEEEPQRLVHHVRKPIIQEIREIIMPYRKVYQQIAPVIEEIHTIVASRRANQNNSNNGKYNAKLPAVISPFRNNQYRSMGDNRKRYENLLATTTTTQSPIEPPSTVESLADVESLVLESKPNGIINSSPSSSSPLTRILYRPNDDVVYHHLRTRKFRRNVTMKQHK